MSRSSLFAALAATLLAVAGFSPAAQAQCQPFPQVSWWGQSSHAREIGIVGSRFGGDWTSYIARWQERLSRLEETRAKGDTAVLGPRRIALRGRQLDALIETVHQRLKVTRCLAVEAAFADETLADDDVAIVGSSGGGATEDPVVTALSTTLPDLEVGGQCRETTARFRVTNTGVPWPGMALFSIVDGAGKPLTGKRRMRLIEGQTATFRADRSDADVLMLRVEPMWGDVAPHQTRIDCRNNRLAAGS